MIISFTIPADKLDEFKAGFLQAHPVPLDDGGVPEMTEIQWFKKWFISRVFIEYRRGKLMLAQNNVVIDKDILE